MSTTRRSTKFAALVVGLSLIAAACGDDDDTTTTGAPPEETSAEGTTAPEGDDGSRRDDRTREARPHPKGTDRRHQPGDAAMTVTFEINPDAVWEDGSPITAADFECTWQASLNTPGSIVHVRLRQDHLGRARHQRQAGRRLVHAARTPRTRACSTRSSRPLPSRTATTSARTSRPRCRSRVVSTCSTRGAPSSRRSCRTRTGTARTQPTVEQLRHGPAARDTEIQALKAGEVDFIYPQFYAGIEDELADPNVAVSSSTAATTRRSTSSRRQAREPGPFADPAFREGFSKSIDLTRCSTRSTSRSLPIANC